MKKQKHRHHGTRPVRAEMRPAAANVQGGAAVSSPKKILIAIPAYTGQVHYTTLGALNLAYSEAAKAGWEIGLSIRSTDSIISRARNVAVADLLRSDCTDLLFLDADVGFGPGVFTRLMSHQVELVCGIYPVRALPENYPVRPLKNWLAYDANGLMEVEAAPTGLMRITRAALEAVVGAHSDEWYEDPTAPGLRIPNVFDFQLVEHEYWSEDYTFCKRYAATGGKVWIDPDLALTHAGDTTYKGHFGEFLRRKLAESQAGAASPSAPAPRPVARPATLSELVRSTIDNAA